MIKFFNFENATFKSLFLFIFGMSLFGYAIMGAKQVDMLTVLQGSQGLFSPFDMLKAPIQLFGALQDRINNFGFDSNNGKLDILDFINVIARIFPTLLNMIFFIVFSIVLIPFATVVWIINGIIMFFDIIGGANIPVFEVPDLSGFKDITFIL